MSFNIIFTFRVNFRNSLWNLVVIFNFRGGSTFCFRPILHSFPTELKNLQRTKTILRDRVPFYQEKEAIFEVILSTCSEFSQIGTPHFSLEGVIDDTYLKGNTFSDCETNIYTIVRLFTDLGATLNMAKSVLIPSQVITLIFWALYSILFK